MLIECPSCGARAKLPESKAGAKVRCGQCERVYLARPVGAREPTQARNHTLPIAIGGGVIGLIVLAIALRAGKSTPPPRVVEELQEAPVAQVDTRAWDGPILRFARSVHDAAYARDQLRLQSMLAEDRIWARVRAAETGEEVDPAAYALLGGPERSAFFDGVLRALVSDDQDNLVGAWAPFDGTLLEEEDKAAIVRLTLQPRDTAQAGTRHIEWKLVKLPSGWRAWSWERWYSPEELAAGRIAQTRKSQQKTLSDGSLVYEAEPERVEYMQSTSPEMRARIESLVTALIDLDSPPRKRTEAQDELRAIGKEAIPGLLNRFYELDKAGWGDDAAVSRGQLVHMTLQDITGYVTTFNPHEALGGTTERRDSGVRQWFSWYQRKFARFEAAPEEVDLLEAGWEPKTEKEKREYERQKRLQEQEKKRP